MKKILKKIIPEQLFIRIVPKWHLLVAILSVLRYGFPARNMKFIGVTGTNGKTTTTNMIYTMLKEAGYSTAHLSTTTYGLNNDVHQQIEHMTTVSAPQLQKRLKDFKEAGAEWVVIEASSHALVQNRVWGVPFEIAVMTNVTHEHLDYHGTFESYREAKRKLFKIVAKSKRNFGVVYAEDPAAKLFGSTTKRYVTYGPHKADVSARSIKLGTDGSNFTAVGDKGEYSMTVNIPGDFNVSNALAAVAVGEELGLSKSQIEKGIAALKGVEARMMKIHAGQNFSVIIDHGGTPDAFQRVFENIVPITKGKLVVVFGSPAHRDKIKRPIQGEIAGKYADVVILTEEDDRDEPGEQIMNDIAVGAEKAGKVRDKDLFLINDRTEALDFAMTLVQSKDDLVISLGKGHEKTIERGNEVFPWSEPDTAKSAIKKAIKANPKAKKVSK